MPHQLTDIINDPVEATWSDIATGFQTLPNYLWDQFQLVSLFGDDGWLGLLTSVLEVDGLPGWGDLAGLLDPILGSGFLDPTTDHAVAQGTPPA